MAARKERSAGNAVSLITVAAVILVSLCPLSAMANKRKDRGARPRSSITLYGQIDELSMLCSAAGIQLSGRGLPATVSKISLGSAASYSGLREGDKVSHIAANGNVLVLDIQRDGKNYQATIATDVTGLRAQFEASKIPYSFGDSPFDKELKTLNEYEIVILLDRSQSMGDTHAGCPGDLSKWMWCKQQIDNLFLATSRVLDRGFNLVLFNNNFQESRGVTLWDLRQLFDRIKPDGLHKDIAAPLDAALNDYFKNRKSQPKPCVILVLSDGTENSGQPLQNVLIEASKKVSRPGEVTVTFLQVGDSISGEELFEDLDHNLVAKGARYHIVTYKPFTELRNKGVLWELLATIRQSQQAMPHHTASSEMR